MKDKLNVLVICDYKIEFKTTTNLVDFTVLLSPSRFELEQNLFNHTFDRVIYFYLKQAFPDTVNRYIFENREIDIFIPSKNIGVEYNGYFSHKKKGEKDIRKKEFFESIGMSYL